MYNVLFPQENLAFPNEKNIYFYFLFIVFNIFLTRLCFIIQMSENRNIFKIYCQIKKQK